MTMSMNDYKAIGNLTRDAELRFLASGQPLLKFGLAVNDRYKDEKGEWKDGKPLFLDCVIWGKAAEKISQQMVKGTMVFVSGKLELDEWDDKETGNKRSKIQLNVFNSGVIERPAKQEESSGRQQESRPAQGRAQPARQASLSDSLEGI